MNLITTIFSWDSQADTISKDDNLREILPLEWLEYQDNEGYTHHIFSKLMFNNLRYVIPQEDFELFQKYLDGGSRSYPSDGNIPIEIAATEALIIINQIIEIAANPEHIFFNQAQKVLKGHKYDIVRGCVKFYLKKYTARDWRRKRFTDDIDFWTFEIDLLKYVLKNNGWVKNNRSKEWEKLVEWIDCDTRLRETGVLIASNDVNQRLDFANGSYLEGSDLKDEIKKKMKRGHDVDLSDIINIAILKNKDDGEEEEDWRRAWEGIEESLTVRDSRIISNSISLCRYAYAIADYIEKVGLAITKFSLFIFDKNEFPNDKISQICRYSAHWTGYLINHGLEATRSMIYSYLIEQQGAKREHSRNLKNFAKKVLDFLNSKLDHVKIIVEIEH